MRLTILGSGTCVPSLTRGAPAHLLEFDEHRLLLDCGPGTMRRLLEIGLTLPDIEAIFFTHSHLDHSGELAPFIFASKYSGLPRSRPLAIFGPPGFQAFFVGLQEVYARWLEPQAFSLHIKETPLKITWEAFGLQVLALELEHSASAVGYRFTASRGKVLTYTGDTDYCAAAVELARDADLLLTECSFPDTYKVEGHLTPDLAGRLAAEANVQRLALTHFYPPVEAVDIAALAAKYYSGPISLVNDLDRFEI